MKTRTGIGFSSFLLILWNSIMPGTCLWGQGDEMLAWKKKAAAATSDSAKAVAHAEMAWLLWESGGPFDTAEIEARRALGFAQAGHANDAGDLACNVLGQLKERENACDKALGYYTYCLALRRMRGDQNAEGRMEMNIGNVLGKQEKYHEAIAAYMRADSLIPDSFRLQKGRIHANIGGAYRHLSDWVEAHKHLERARQIRELLGDAAEQARTFLNLGHLYFDQGNQARAGQSYLKCVDLLGAELSPADRARAYSGLSVSMLRMQEPDSALNWCMQGIAVWEALGDSVELAGALNNRGLVFEALGKMEAARSDFQAAANVFAENGRTASEASALNNLGSSHLRSGQAAKAESLLLRARALAWKEGGRTLLLDIFENLHEAARVLGRKTAAIRYAQAQDSLEAEIQTELSAVVNLREDIQEARHAQSISQQQLLTEQERAARERVVLLAIVGGSILFSVLALLALLNLRTRNRALNAEKELQQRENQIERILNEHVAMNAEAMIRGIESERVRISQELHDSLQNTIVVIKRQFENMEDKISDQQTELLKEFRHAVGQLGSSVEEIRRISHNLEQGNLREYGLLPALQSLAHSISIHGGLQAQVFADSLSGQSRPPLSFEYLILLLVNELVSNALKHSEANSLEIQLLLDDERMLTITVIDDGKGFDADAPSFKPGKGIRSIMQRVNLLGGAFEIDSKPGNGTVVTIQLPYPPSSLIQNS